MSLKLEYEWIDPEGARGAELRATWAMLEIRFGEESITRLIDRSSRSVRSSLFLPLYPLAEWIASHWWFLLNEVETLGRATSSQYERRHNIRHGAEGFALPSLLIQPLGESVRLSWEPISFKAQNLEITSRGAGNLSSSDLREALADFISAVIKRLHAEGVGNTLLEQEWSSIQSAELEEREFCSAAASLGLDPYALDDEDQNSILAAGDLLPSSILGDFFSVADWPSLLPQACQVRDALETSRKNRGNLKSLKMLRDDLTGFRLTGSPWDQGYQFAHELRKRLGLNGTRLGSLPTLGKALDISGKSLEAAITKVSILPASLDALVATNSRESPGFAIPAHRREAAVRFAFCRALFEYLTVSEERPLLVTRAHSDRQKRNRAFAAEFLVPAELLQAALPSAAIEDDEIDELAADFGVSPSVIRHQIENHKLAALPDERVLLA